jgi:hypothetical protein
MNKIKIKCPTDGLLMAEAQELFDKLYYIGYISSDSYLSTWGFEPGFVFAPAMETAAVCSQCNGTGIEKVQLLTSAREYPCSKCQGK